MTSTIDQIMESASEALARMAYLPCEQLCMQALAHARQAADWALYARILLPLQESRRQRRMTAAEGGVRLGTTKLVDEPANWLTAHPTCCIVLTRPHNAETARLLKTIAQDQQLNIEILLADNTSDAPQWNLQSFAGPAAQYSLTKPSGDQQECWTASPQWFLLASEMLGDVAIQNITAPPGTLQRVTELEACLDVVTDHEILHQQLWRAAKALTNE